MQLSSIEREYLVRERQESLCTAIEQSARAPRVPNTARISPRERAAQALVSVALLLSPQVVDARRMERSARLGGGEGLAGV
jgi:hypothetical protein